MVKSVLIADDDQDIVDLLTLHCERLGLRVDQANNAMTALGKIEEHLPDAAILDVDMPCGNGLCVREMMANHDELQSIPVIMLTGSTSESTVRRCHENDAYYVLKCPDVWTRVEPVLRDLFDLHAHQVEVEDASGVATSHPEPGVRDGADLMDAVFAIIGSEESTSAFDEDATDAQRSDAPWVLSIEDDDDFALALRLRLQQYGVQVIRAAAGMEGYRRAFMDAPRAIILDYELPQGNGDYVIRRLKESSVTCEIPVIALTGRREASIERQMRGLGASEFLTKPLDWKRLRVALEACLDTNASTGELAGA